MQRTFHADIRYHSSDKPSHTDSVTITEAVCDEADAEDRAKRTFRYRHGDDCAIVITKVVREPETPASSPDCPLCALKVKRVVAIPVELPDGTRASLRVSEGTAAEIKRRLTLAGVKPVGQHLILINPEQAE